LQQFVLVILCQETEKALPVSFDNVELFEDLECVPDFLVGFFCGFFGFDDVSEGSEDL